MSPFPALVYDDGSLRGEDELHSWAAFQPRRGPYGAIGPKGASGAIVGVSVVVGSRKEPSDAQVNAYRELKEHEARFATAVQLAVFDQYPAWRAREIAAAAPDVSPEDWFALTGRRSPPPSERRHVMHRLPEITTPQELVSFCGLHCVHVLECEHAGRAYIGFELGAAWEKEHGADVLMYGDQIVGVGHADVSFHEALARAHSETYAQRT